MILFPMTTISEALAIALQYQQAGQLQTAEQIYRQILQVEPNDADAIHLLGMIAHQVGKHEIAVEYIERAIELNGTDAAFHNNLGEVYRGMRRIPEAVACYRRALELKPDYAEAHNNLGNAMQGQGKLDESITCYRRSLELRPGFAEAHNNLGAALQALGRLDEAVACCRRALEFKPCFAEAQYNLGNSLKESGNLDEAVASYRRALEMKPNFAKACNNLGIALREEGEQDEAVACYRRALELMPTFPEAQYNLGIAVSDQGKVDEAIICFRRALELMPEYAEAHDGLLFVLNYDPAIDDRTLYAEHLRYGEVYDLVGFFPRYANQPDPQRRLRIGYVSPDFCRHPVAYFVEPMLRHHDPQEVEIFLYSQVNEFDDVTARIRALPHTWRDICRLKDGEAAELIRVDKIDILVDLAGHTKENRLQLFALRPAPVQVTYLGFPNTTGMKSIQYLLTDAIVDPPDTTQQYTEQLVRLPHGYCCIFPKSDAPDVNALPAVNRGYVTFGSLHTLLKLNSGVLDLWCEILRAVPESRLLLLRNTLKGAAEEAFQREFSQRGMSPERVEFRHDIPPGGLHLPVYHDIDVALDTFPWCGHTTACESLWMGVPIVTLRGNRHAGRLVTSVLHSAGLDDWVATSKEAYVQRAVRAAADLPALATLRSSLRVLVANSALCDPSTFTRDVEHAYREMWNNWCNKTADDETGKRLL
jgi:protein O-GlcNAc transferase